MPTLAAAARPASRRETKLQRIYRRAALGVTLALGLLVMVPATAFAAQPSCGDTLTANTTLTADLDCSAFPNGTALYMGKYGIVLDLNGFTIWGDGTPADDTDTGVDTNGFHHTVIKNGSISNFSTGIYVDYSNDTRIKHVSISAGADTNDTAVYIDHGAGNIVRHVTLNTFSYGVYIYYSASNKVSYSDMDQVGTGIYVERGAANVVTGNTVDPSDNGVLDYYGSENRYVGNVVEGGSGTGYYIDCDTSGRVFMIDNTARDFANDGFYTSECYGNNDSWAPGTGSVMRGNRAIGNGDDGFDDSYSVNSTWTGNRANWNDDDGFVADEPSAFTMRYNIANHNGDDGFEFTTAYSELAPYLFSWNTARYNGDYGMYSDTGIPSHHNVSRNSGTQNCYNVNCN
jgi:nitrous oxidase accessory protein NosD